MTDPMTDAPELLPDDFRVMVAATVCDGMETVLDEGCNVQTRETAAEFLRDWADKLSPRAPRPCVDLGIVGAFKELDAICHDEYVGTHYQTYYDKQYLDWVSKHAPLFRRIATAGHLSRVPDGYVLVPRNNGIIQVCIDLVSSWHKNPNDRHPSRLGVTIKTDCGTVYEVSDAAAPPTDGGS